MWTESERKGERQGNLKKKIIYSEWNLIGDRNY